MPQQYECGGWDNAGEPLNTLRVLKASGVEGQEVRVVGLTLLQERFGMTLTPTVRSNLLYKVFGPDLTRRRRVYGPLVWKLHTTTAPPERRRGRKRKQQGSLYPWIEPSPEMLWRARDHSFMENEDRHGHLVRLFEQGGDVTR